MVANKQKKETILVSEGYENTFDPNSITDYKDTEEKDFEYVNEIKSNDILHFSIDGNHKTIEGTFIGSSFVIASHMTIQFKLDRFNKDAYELVKVSVFNRDKYNCIIHNVQTCHGYLFESTNELNPETANFDWQLCGAEYSDLCMILHLAK